MAAGDPSPFPPGDASGSDHGRGRAMLESYARHGANEIMCVCAKLLAARQLVLEYGEQTKFGSFQAYIGALEQCTPTAEGAPPGPPRSSKSEVIQTLGGKYADTITQDYETVLAGALEGTSLAAAGAADADLGEGGFDEAVAPQRMYKYFEAKGWTSETDLRTSMRATYVANAPARPPARPLVRPSTRQPEPRPSPGPVRRPPRPPLSHSVRLTPLLPIHPQDISPGHARRGVKVIAGGGRAARAGSACAPWR